MDLDTDVPPELVDIEGQVQIDADDDVAVKVPITIVTGRYMPSSHQDVNLVI